MHRGGVAGSLFALVLEATVACRIVPEGGLPAVVFVLAAAVFASVPAFVLGMIAGFVLGCVDLLCINLSIRLARACVASTP